MPGSYRTCSAHLAIRFTLGCVLLATAGCSENPESTAPGSPRAAAQFARNAGPDVLVIDLGPGEARGVNDAAQVAIQSGRRAAFWSDPDGVGTGIAGTRIELETPPGYSSSAYAVNNTSSAALPQVVGGLSTDGENPSFARAVRWRMTSAKPLTFSAPEPIDPDPSVGSIAFGVNDAGDATGSVSAAGCPPDPTRVGSYGALWSAAGEKTIICPLGAPFDHDYIRPDDVNNSGIVVGASSSRESVDSYRGFAWWKRADGHVVMIALPPAPGDVGSYAWAVSELAPGAQVFYAAGWTFASGGFRRPARWTITTSGEVGYPEVVADNGWAMSAHTAGHVAGTTITRGHYRAFLWDATRQALTTLHPLKGYDASMGRGGVSRGTAPGTPIYVAGESHGRTGTRATLWRITAP